MATARPGLYSPVGYQQITDVSTAVGLTPPSKEANCAIVQATDQDVRWRDDGTSPTASVGMQLAVGFDIYYQGDLNRVKFIEETAGAVLNITYYSSSVGGI